jgi:hypothetical protein
VALRAGGVGDTVVGAAEHEDLQELVEDHPVADALAMAAERMGDVAGRQEDVPTAVELRWRSWC